MSHRSSAVGQKQERNKMLNTDQQVEYLERKVKEKELDFIKAMREAGTLFSDRSASDSTMFEIALDCFGTARRTLEEISELNSQLRELREIKNKEE